MLFLLIFCIFKHNWLVVSSAGDICSTGGDPSPLSDSLRWNFTESKDCDLPGKESIPCTDVRICKWAVASLFLHGKPKKCAQVRYDVEKVCCGLPLVLGPRLIEKVDEEKARKRECGTRGYSQNLSPTENKLFEIYNALPDVDTSDATNFDPPLDLSKERKESTSSGKVTRQADFPWMVTVFNGSSFRCGGSLIDRSHVLSAAHCFVTQSGEPEDPLQFTVRVGDIHIDDGVAFSVKDIKLHEEYVPQQLYNDIAILTIEKELLTPVIAHICLPDETIAAMDFTGKSTTSLGWNNNETAVGPYLNPLAEEKRTRKRKLNSILRIVDDLPALSTGQCRYVHQQVDFESSLPRGITDDFICAGHADGRTDPCQKDSGGVLMYSHNYVNLPDKHPNIPWVLVGIGSFGYACDDPRYPAVYTRVSSYMDWIQKNTS